MTKSSLWSSTELPIFHLQRLTAGLRLQYLQQWCKVADLDEATADDQQRTFVKHENLPTCCDLASYPMQLAILLHLLNRRGFLPQQRLICTGSTFETFLDEQTENKEPLLSSQRDVIVDIHAFLGWHLQKQAEDGWSASEISRTELKNLLRQHPAGHEKGQELAKQLFSAMESRVLCLVEREPGYYFQFEVQSLREYFAAVYVDQYADPRGSARGLLRFSPGAPVLAEYVPLLRRDVRQDGSPCEATGCMH